MSELAAQVTRIIERVLTQDAQRVGPLDLDVPLTLYGLDSMNMGEIVLALEEELGIAEFPIQAWLDAQDDRPEPHHTLRSIVELCRELCCSAGAAR